ncbi:MAG: thioredoxin family protein [Armatimonadota bacterium]
MPDRKKMFIVLAVVLAALLVLAYKDDPSARAPRAGGADAVVADSGSSHSATEESESGLPRFVEVGAESCVPCKMMQPILDEMREEYDGEMEVVMADVHKTPELGRKYNVRSIPTQIIYDAEGNEVFRHIGFWPKDEIDAKLKELGIIE